MFCRECGTANPDDSKFCESCGTGFSGASTPSGGGRSDRSSAGGGAPAPALGALGEGTVVGGTYEIVDIVGGGGMGVVYRARHARLGHEVAIKVLASNLAQDAGLMDRFETEARVQAQLRHPNIVAVHDFLNDAGVSGIVMDLINGITLETLIQDHTGPIPALRCITLMSQVLDAIGFAHTMGIVHRDLKTSNVMIEQAGGREIAKVTDFGIAKVLAEGGRKTATGTKMGTLHYMSPEQCRGQKDIDHRADIYSLGATLFEMATGQVPFDVESEFEMYRSHIEVQPPAPTSIYPGVPPALEAAILKALAKDKEERFQSAEEFLGAFGAVEGAAVAMAVGAAATPVAPVPAGPPAKDIKQAAKLCKEAKTLEGKAQLGKAITKLKKAIDLHPGNSTAQEMLTRVRSKLEAKRVQQACAKAKESIGEGDDEDALDLFDKAVKAAGERPDLIDFVTGEITASMAALVEKGDTLFDRLDIQEALALWELVARHYPQTEGLAQRLEQGRKKVEELGPAGLKLIEGDKLFEQGKYLLALKIYDEAELLGAEPSELEPRLEKARAARAEELFVSVGKQLAAKDWQTAAKTLGKIDRYVQGSQSLAEALAKTRAAFFSAMLGEADDKFAAKRHIHAFELATKAEKLCKMVPVSASRVAEKREQWRAVLLARAEQQVASGLWDSAEKALDISQECGVDQSAVSSLRELSYLIRAREFYGEEEYAETIEHLARAKKEADSRSDQSRDYDQARDQVEGILEAEAVERRTSTYLWAFVFVAGCALLLYGGARQASLGHRRAALMNNLSTSYAGTVREDLASDAVLFRQYSPVLYHYLSESGPETSRGALSELDLGDLSSLDELRVEAHAQLDELVQQTRTPVQVLQSVRTRGQRCPDGSAERVELTSAVAALRTAVRAGDIEGASRLASVVAEHECNRR